MKVLKVIGAIILILLVIFLIAGLFGPKSVRIERSTLIQAPPKVIFAEIADYRNWPKWSPWAHLDSSIRYEYSGPQGQADASVKWYGNNKAGEGMMHTTELAQDVSMVYHISFIRPFKSECSGTFKLDSADHGDTKITWIFEMQIPFLMRPMMLMMNVDKHVAPDYEKGLASLKTECEGDYNRARSATEVYEVKRGKKTYVGYRLTTSFDSLSGVFMTWMPKVFAYVKENKLMMDGPPSGLYYTWNTDKKTTDMAVAIPVKSVDKVSGGFSILTIDEPKALETDYYGSYDKMGTAHDLMNRFISDNKLKKIAPAVEEYVTDPGTEKDTAKILTRIIYFTE